MILDGQGFYGFCLHYCLLFAFFGSALFVFLYLWRKKRLDMDEEPKLQIFEEQNGRE